MINFIMGLMNVPSHFVPQVLFIYMLRVINLAGPLQEENVEQSLIKGDDVAQPFPGIDVILTFHQDVNFTWSINERNVYMSEGLVRSCIMMKTIVIVEFMIKCGSFYHLTVFELESKCGMLGWDTRSRIAEYKVLALIDA